MYWRVIGTSPGNVEKCVKATCVLHNFIRWTAGSPAAERQAPDPVDLQPIRRVGTNNATREAIHWECLICHKDMGLASQVLCFWQQPVFREVQSAILQGLAELGAGQGPSITSPPIGANVHHAETVPGIYNCQEDDGVCPL
ncbi:hypothetical protein AAFF_G00223410 [Aldrovandia affinis]|uniref:Nuclease HARBI1 n=1 Tax=Aldrovandia affinis TaxID=143900 RepID=A0AAD7TBW3_9TELE|nr:hypothetical protein AAFF_G00223410 [Aldrovandia affinis]